MKTIKTLKNFFFPDDTKIKIECSIFSSVNENGQQKTYRKFFTFRSICAHFYGEYKKYINEVAEFHKIKPFPEYRISLQKGAITIGTTTSGTFSSGVIALSVTPSGSNVALVAGVGGVRQLNFISFNGTEDFTKLTESLGGSGRCTLAYLVNPTLTTADVEATLDSTGSASMGVTILSGVNTSSLIDNSSNNTFAATTSVTTNITTNYVNSLLIDVITSQNNPTPNGSQTALWNQNPSNFDEGSRKATTTAGSYSMNWTFSSSGGATSVVAIREYSASGPANLKSYNTNVAANIKSIDTNLIANIKSLNTNV